jgi:hypothetical protein
MPRPRKFTEVERRERTQERLRELFPGYEPPTEAPLVYDAEAAAEDQRRAEAARVEFNKRTEREIKDLLAFAADAIAVLGLVANHRRAWRVGKSSADLAALLPTVKWEFQHRRSIVRPTPAEMRATLADGLRHAEALRDWYRSLPDALLLNQRVSMMAEPLPGDDPPVLGVVIERLAETLSSLADQYQAEQGRQPGERAAAQGAACYLIRFMDRHAPDASIEKRREFMFQSMRKQGITCPNLRDHQGDFNKWFGEVEALARPTTKAEMMAAPNDPTYTAALKRLKGAAI